MKNIKTMLYWMSIYYRWPFWKMVRDGNEVTLEGRGWLHSLKDILLFPLWLVMAFCASVIGVFDTTAYKKTMYLKIKNGEEMSPALKRFVKRKLLER